MSIQTEPFRLIPLTQGRFALVDAEDWEMLSKFKWTYTKKGYAYRREGGRRNGRTVYMHRVIRGTPTGLSTDHINMDKLDNRRCNLRVCDHRKNQANTPKRYGRSRFKGVSWNSERNKWSVYVAAKFVGRFDSELDAARAYNQAALRNFGEFARLNEVDA